MYINLYYSFLILYYNIYTIQGLSNCCAATRSKPCRRNCLKLVADHKLRFRFSYVSRRLSNIVKTCPRSESFFWNCIVSSDVWRDFRADALQRNSKYGFCCREAKHLSCEIKCLTSKKPTLLSSDNCNAMREPEMSQCMNQVDASEGCCHSGNANCVETCQKYFKSSTSVAIYMPLQNLENACGRESRIYRCAITQTNISNLVEDYRTCCTLGKSYSCERRCREVLANPAGYDDMFQALTGQCGTFDPSESIFKCLLKMSIYKIQREKNSKALEEKESALQDIGGNKFEQQCCDRAISQECQQWCSKILSRPSLMTLWDTMYLKCIQNPMEAELSSCVSDILEPCELSGNTQLKFCSHLNNRPLELFRRFNNLGDSSAHKFHELWAIGDVQVLSHKLVFKDVNKCEPEKFKALACLISIKPCDHHTVQRQVCRADCEGLLSECLDYAAMKTKTKAKDICAAILPNNNQTNCISFEDYLHKPNTLPTNKEVTIPCSGNPCNDNEICQLNRNCSPNDVDCQTYECVKGCVVSPKSQLVVPPRDLAKLPVKENGKDCYKICQCRSIPISSGKQELHYFGSCKKFGCKHKTNCTVNGRIYRDGEVFKENCNTCVCNDGNKVCTEKDCKKVIVVSNNIRPRRDHEFIDNDVEKSCDCHHNYEPVCSKSGMTFVNPCHAKCCQMDDRKLDVGDCQHVDPCNPNPCSKNLHCNPNRHVCLSQWIECPQYTCTFHKHNNATCDSPAEAIQQTMCGFDGVTYRNSDVLQAAGTGIDYIGPCLPQQYQNLDEKIDRCKKIDCGSLDVDCDLIKLPGSCCPVCGSSLRILYSQRDMLRHHNYVSFDPFSVKDIVFHLRNLLQVMECRLYAHVLVPGELIVGILTDSRNPSRSQFIACRTEALKINKYINQKSPITSTNYYLSILKASQLHQKDWNKVNSSTCNRTSFSFVFLCYVIYYIANKILVR